MREESWDQADTLIRRKFGFTPWGDRVLFAVKHQDSISERGLRAQARDTAGIKGRRTAGFALEAGWLLAIYLEDLKRAEDFTRAGTASSLSPGLQASAHQQLANLAVAAGRWEAAKPEFAAAATGHPDSALVGRALAATLPFLGVPQPDLQAVKAEVERWQPGSDVSAPLPESLRQLTPHLRLYLLGLLSARQGDRVGALRYAGEMDRLVTPSDSRALVKELAGTIRADVAAGAGRYKEALAQLDSLKGEVPFELIRLPYFSGEHARYLRSQLLQHVGRQEEGLHLLEVGFTGTPNELHYRAPTHLLRAGILQHLNRRAEAIEQYSRLVALWGSCDPALRPVVDDAKAELAALTAEPQ